MDADHNDSKALAEAITQAVEACLPTQFERSAAHSQLLNKVRSLLEQAQPAATEHKVHPAKRSATLLFADILAFNTLADTYSAKVVMDILNRYLSTMSEVIGHYNGRIEQLKGDSLSVVFASESQADNVENGLACAVAMQRAMTVFNEQNIEMGIPEIYMGIGVNTGEVLTGVLAQKERRQFAVIGDEVNLTCRIEAQSLRGQILISESSYRLAEAYVLVGLPNTVQVRARQEPVCLYELLGTTRPRTLTVPRREIRKSPRIEINMPCYFHIVEDRAVKSQRCCAEVLDMSYNGLLIKSPVMLAAYSEIKMELSLQLLSGETTDIYARIIQCEQQDDGYRCSLEFTSVDLAGQRTIKRFVDNHIYQS